MITLETNRLLLRRPNLSDLEPYISIFGDERVARFMSVDGKPLSRFAVWNGLCGAIGHWELRGYGMFTVIEKSTGTVVGRVGALYPEQWPDFEIGWAIDPRSWGKGYATESARRCVDWAFTDLGREHLVSLIEADNARSIRVAEKLGEEIEGTFSLPHLPPGRKHLQFGVSRESWNARG